MEIIKEYSITAPKGFLASGVHCGLKKNRKDLALIYSEVLAVTSAVYTKNLVKGAPLLVTKDHLRDGLSKGIIINSGNANTCNGKRGITDAYKMTSLISKELNLKSSDILVASTGVIGVPLDIEKIELKAKDLVSSLSKLGSSDAASAIMTTDTIKKEFGVSFSIDENIVTIGCISKGSGMIEPNMGTMLSFITTDINIEKKLLDEALKEAVNETYNRVTVDGDTSTNDMVIIMANGLSKNPKITKKDEDYYNFLDMLKIVTLNQAKLIAKDGEGATKLISCTVTGAKTVKDCVKLSKSVIKSSLVKTAFFGSDANWGRVACALGYANIPFDTEKLDIYFKSSKGEILLCSKGEAVDFNEDNARNILVDDEILIIVNLGAYNTSATCYGCDLTYDYVKINGDYRS
ncbi:bifunctional glutamate N-acetyltransferase/amino-acid acetyltransferase ArgJ [Clostridium chrysemydis]|uniref:bifunctional glutamate N-acetyltransferase/amino-acid acetyltransferase ArgJ n=1 Tax=Clostridium chrysemydis TaxID=2665504 RepID=UPI00188327F7|nr:bifunctional glutamate N-acetyltransferase/amino-acid acetyltransferase ArgJ [Clostridium chrysemydis]